uniref:Uncharacterized protein n=1 Tax=Rhizophora mucronata TaxID=61149 RepID=A0A2P2PFL8_RHIMU
MVGTPYPKPWLTHFVDLWMSKVYHITEHSTTFVSSLPTFRGLCFAEAYRILQESEKSSYFWSKQAM